MREERGKIMHNLNLIAKTSGTTKTTETTMYYADTARRVPIIIHNPRCPCNPIDGITRT